MGHIRRLVLFAVLGVATLVVAAPALAAGPAPAAREPQTSDPGQIPSNAAGRVIVKLRRDVTASSVSALARRADARLLRRLRTAAPSDNDLAVLQARDGSAAALVKELNSDPRVLYAEPDHVLRAFETTPNDPGYSLQWALPQISAPLAWDITTGDSSVIVAVIDSGVKWNHEDIIDNRWGNASEMTGMAGVDDDGNGYIDDIWGIDRADYDNNPMDEEGHGTHVAGTIAATGDNGKGVAGVAWTTQIMALRFLDEQGLGFTSDAVDCINYAIWQKEQGGAEHEGQNVVAINASWGGGENSLLLLDAIEKAGEAGIVFVAAAGNEGSDNDLTPMYPASYDAPNLISVLATNQSDGMPGFSNWGATRVDIGAPGVDILSTVPGGYAYLDGTSMATPHVTGAIALSAVAEPDDTVVERVARVLWSADPAPALLGNSVTGRRLNVEAPLKDDELPGLGLEPPFAGLDPLNPPAPPARSGSLDAAADQRDVYRIPLNPGDELTLTLTGAAGSDFEAVVLSQDETALQQTTGSYPKTLDYTATEAGVYSISVVAQSGSGAYSLAYQVTYADVTPPATTVTGADARWRKTPVMLRLPASDGGSGVAYVEYSLDGASFRKGARRVVRGNKAHTVAYRAVDFAGNVESAHTVNVRIDAGRPAPSALAKVTVAKGKKATMRFRVKDVTPKVTVTIKVYKGSKLVKTLKVGSRPTGANQSYKWTCALAKGTYTWKVYAKDQAGNTQRKPASKSLVVR